MSTELTILAWTLVLALVQVALTATVAVRDKGLPWAAGARDAPGAAESALYGRLSRAQRNLFETLPLFAAAVLIAHVAGREGATTRLGAELFLAGRVVHLPLYVFGVRYVRTLAWAVAVVGLVMVVVAILGG